MEENGFHQSENQRPLVKIWYFFKNGLTSNIYILILVTVSTYKKNSEQKKKHFHQRENLFPLVGMKDFVEIKYSVLWKLCFGQSYFWLVETI